MTGHSTHLRHLDPEVDRLCPLAEALRVQDAQLDPRSELLVHSIECHKVLHSVASLLLDPVHALVRTDLGVEFLLLHAQVLGEHSSVHANEVTLRSLAFLMLLSGHWSRRNDRDLA